MPITRSPFHLTILAGMGAVGAAVSFTCGMALLLSALAVYFADSQYLYGIAGHGLDVRHAVVLPHLGFAAFMVAIIKLNPLYHYINCMRCLVMYGTVPGPNTWFAWASSVLWHDGGGPGGFPQTAAQLYSVSVRSSPYAHHSGG